MIIVKLYFCTVTLQGDVSFKGFLIQARTAGTTTPIGEFTSLQSGSQTLSCSGVSSASVSWKKVYKQCHGKLFEARSS